MRSSETLDRTQVERPHVRHPRVLWPLGHVDVGASLMGVIAETCADTVQETTATVLEAAGAPHHRSFDIALSGAVDPARLAYVLRLPVPQVQRLYHPRIERTKGPPLYSFFGAWVPRYDLQFRRRCVGPSALAQSPFHRAIWCHSLVPFCTKTGEWLVDSCPRCSRQLGWYHTQGIARCDDPACGFDLRLAEGLSVDEQRFAVAAPIARLLDPDPEVHEPARAALPSEFRALNRGAAFELIWRLGRLHLEDPLPRDEHRKLDREEIVATICTGASFLADWPQSMDRMLRQTAALGDADRTLSLVRALRKMARKDVTWPEHRQVLDAAFPYFDLRDRAIVMELVDDAADGEEAARVLGVSFAYLANMNRLGLLQAQAVTGEHRLHGLFSRSTLDDLRSQLKDRAHLGRGAQRIGVSIHGVEQLVCLGQIAVVDGPLIQGCYDDVQISRSGVDRLIDRIISSQTLAAGCKGAVLLRRVLMRIGGRDKPWGPILTTLLNGAIPYGVLPGTGPLARRIILPADAVAGMLSLTFDKTGRDFCFAQTMTRRDAQEMLNLQPAQMLRALENELRPAITQGGDLRRDQILHTAGLRISGGEVLARWSTGRKIPVPLLDDRRFPRLGATGWVRADVEKELGPDHR